MQKTTINKERILVGITARTNNKAEMSGTGKIGQTYGTYFSQGIAAQIPHRKNPGTTFSAYTEFESDETGEYTYFLGEEATELSELPEGLVSITIPTGEYSKFTTPQGPLVNGIVSTWQKIWGLNKDDLGADKRFAVDFEVHDERAANPDNGVADIYIGLK